ncbi:MAG TPA: CPBP family intramembrane glutamic endopeptidase [Polyangiaceae bacterium]|nr:CPBP family intramembrane glutamic endopeptidase [Polyangiaceae bacterium]
MSGVVRAGCALSCVLLFAGESAGMQPARTSAGEPEKPRERRAREAVAASSCSAAIGLLFPGVAQFCLGKTAEGAVISGLAAAELGVGVSALAMRDEGLDALSEPSVSVPLVALQYLWVYSYLDGVFERQRAQHLRYVPLDTPAELALAPFTPSVLAKPDVWAGILGSLALGIGATALIDGGISSDDAGEDPRLFGRTFSPGVGYPLAAAVGTGIFTHVAVAEEAVFRGFVQSQMSREMDETRGWVGASLAFGAAHAPNVIGLSEGRQAAYLAVAVPLITMLGGYLGMSYRWHDYSLAPPVAIHFWYDLLLSSVDYVLDPRNSSISGRVSLPF